MKTLALCICFFTVFIPNEEMEINPLPFTLQFDQKLTMTVNSAKDDTAEVDYFFNSHDSSLHCMRISADFEMGSTEAVYLLFRKDKIEMLMSAAGIKMRKTISKDEFDAMDNQYDIPKQSEVIKTGNQKTILGYSCDEYRIETNEGNYNAWVCKSFPIDNDFIPMVGSRAESPFKGFVMEINSEIANEKANLKITAIDLNANLTLDTSAYKDFKF